MDFQSEHLFFQIFGWNQKDAILKFESEVEIFRYEAAMNSKLHIWS